MSHDPIQNLPDLLPSVPYQEVERIEPSVIILRGRALGANARPLQCGAVMLRAWCPGGLDVFKVVVGEIVGDDEDLVFLTKADGTYALECTLRESGRRTIYVASSCSHRAREVGFGSAVDVVEAEQATLAKAKREVAIAQAADKKARGA